MSEAAAETVLERKAQAQRRALGTGSVSIPRALGRSLSIAADALWGLSASCTADRDETIATDRALARMPADMLFLLLEKEDRPPALLVLDRDMVTGLIEVQTLGKVTRFPLDSRAFTATDAAMMAPWVDAALPRFGSMLVTQPEHAHLQDYAFGAQLEDAQTAGLALEVDHVQVISFSISLAQDTRRGQAFFLFPEPPKQSDSDDVGRRHGKHEEAMKMVPARMHAVLTRIHVPLSRAQALKPGDVLEISPNALTSASLVVDGGHIAAKGKLGQMNGFRAVRIGDAAQTLHQPPAPAPHGDVQTGKADAPLDFQPPATIPYTTGRAMSSDGMALDNLSIGLTDPADLI